MKPVRVYQKPKKLGNGFYFDPDENGSFLVVSIKDYNNLIEQMKNKETDFNELVIDYNKIYDEYERLTREVDNWQLRADRLDSAEADLRQRSAHFNDLLDNRSDLAQKECERRYNEKLARLQADYNKKVAALNERNEAINAKEQELQEQQQSAWDETDRLFKQNRELKNAQRGITPKGEHTGFCLQRVEEIDNRTFFYKYYAYEGSSLNSRKFQGDFRKLTIELPCLSSQIRSEMVEEIESELREDIIPQFYQNGTYDLSFIGDGILEKASEVFENAEKARKAGVPVIARIQYYQDLISGYWKAAVFCTADPTVIPWEVSQPSREQAQKALKDRKKAQKRQPRPKPKEIN